MARHSLNRTQYITMGDTRGMIFLGDEHTMLPPSSTYTKTRWKCRRCSKISLLTYRALQSERSRGCTCRNTRNGQIKEQDYRKKAKDLGLLWLFDKEKDAFPTNSKEKSSWYFPLTGDTLEMSWHTVSVRTPVWLMKRVEGLLRREDYQQKAEELGIEWVETPHLDSFPKDFRDPTTWKNPRSSKKIVASWDTLFKGLPEELLEILELAYE